MIGFLRVTNPSCSSTEGSAVSKLSRIGVGSERRGGRGHSVLSADDVVGVLDTETGVPSTVIIMRRLKNDRSMIKMKSVGSKNLEFRARGDGALKGRE
jgi:hypothetical protein